MKNNNVYYGNVANPIWFVFILMAMIGLYLFRLTPTINEPSFETILLLLLFLLSATLGFVLNLFKCKKSITIDYSYRLSKLGFCFLWGMYFFSCGVYLLEHYIFFVRFGSVPIGLIDFEIKRLLFPVNGYMHLVAIMNYMFLLVIIFSLLLESKTKGNYKVFVYFCCLFSIVLSVLVGNRGVVFSFVFFILIMFSFRKKVSFLKMLTFSLFGGYLLGVAKFIRDYLYVGDAIFISLERNWSLGSSYLLGPLYYTYMTFVMNFEMLNKYVEANFEHTYGYFTLFSPFASFLPFELVELKGFQSKILGIDFHGTLTATGIGVPYIDFSFLSVFFVFFWVYLLSFIYKLIILKGKVLFIPLYSYLFFNVLLMVYTYSFNKFYVLLNIVFLFFVPFLFRKTQLKV